MAKTIYVVFKTARQYDGEYHFVSAEKAFESSEKAEKFWRQQSQTYWNETIEGVECRCERAIHPVELLED